MNPTPIATPVPILRSVAAAYAFLISHWRRALIAAAPYTLVYIVQLALMQSIGDAAANPVIAMGVFLFSHGAHPGILAMSGQPLVQLEDGGARLKGPPILGAAETLVDPLPQALILTSIVISFAVTAFLLTLLVVTQRRSGTLSVVELAHEGMEPRASLARGEDA